MAAGFGKFLLHAIDFSFAVRKSSLFFFFPSSLECLLLQVGSEKTYSKVIILSVSTHWVCAIYVQVMETSLLLDKFNRFLCAPLPSLLNMNYFLWVKQYKNYFFAQVLAPPLLIFKSFIMLKNFLILSMVVELVEQRGCVAFRPSHQSP